MCWEAIDTNYCPACNGTTNESELMLCKKVKATVSEEPCKTLQRPVKRHIMMLIEECPNFANELHTKHVKDNYKKGIPKEASKSNDKGAGSGEAPKTKTRKEVPKKASKSMDLKAVLNSPIKSRRGQARKPPHEEQESTSAPERKKGLSL